MVADWRRDAFWIAMAARVPHLERCALTFDILQARGRLADTGAHEPPAKALLDGLVDAGVIDDDSGRQVATITFRAPQRSPDAIDRIIVTISEVTP